VLGAAEGDKVAITEGVQPGERVVLEGVDALREDVTVEVVGTGSAADAAPPPQPPAARQRGGRSGQGQGKGQAPGPNAPQNAPQAPGGQPKATRP
jgi:multidrug efflux system membrane fusion protein